MRRRHLFKLMAGTAAATSLPLQAGAAGQPPGPRPIRRGFDRDAYSHAQCCAMAHRERIFYALRGNAIVAQRLNEARWRPSGGGNPPPLPDVSYVKNFYDRSRDLIDQHDPDLLDFDTALLPLGWGGMNLRAYYYNRSLTRHGGRVEGVITVKNLPARLEKSVLADIERGLSGQIRADLWQSETCLGHGHYLRAQYDQPGVDGGYRPPREVIHWRIDTVSQNGTFTLNVPGKPEGTIDAKERLMLHKIGAWLTVNAEAIYATRPWTVYAQGPSAIHPGSFQGKSVQRLSAADIRVTRNKATTVVYTIALRWPPGALLIRSLGAHAPRWPGRIRYVELLGEERALQWHHCGVELSVTLPPHRGDDMHALARRIHLA